MTRWRPVLGWAAAAIAAPGLLLLAGWWQVDGPGATRPVDPRPVPLSQTDFDPIDPEGRAVGPQTLPGRPTLLFLGFTCCPGVCPTPWRISRTG